MGAKSNNLKVLRDKLDKSILIPKSGCIPFKMFEYTLKLEPEIERLINTHIDELNKTTNVKKMNNLLDLCKEEVLKLKLSPKDKHH